MTDINVPNKVHTLTLNYLGPWQEQFGVRFEVIIDGKPLDELVNNFEQDLPYDTVGDYMPALSSPDVLIHATKNTEQPHEVLMPLVCCCGDWDCCFLTCKVTIEAEYILWSDWQLDYRNKALRPDDFNLDDFKNFPTLKFEKNAYLAELSKAQKLASDYNISQDKQ